MVINNTVISPAGETIEILTDADWIKRAKGMKVGRSGNEPTARGLTMWNAGIKRFIVADLWRNGPVLDPQSGRAAHVMWDRIRDTFGDDAMVAQPNSFSTLCGDPMNAPAFERDTRAKRTYAINLIALPRTWFDKLMMDEQARDVAEQARKEREANEQLADATTTAIGELIDAPTESVNGTDPTERESDAESDKAFDDMIRDMELDAPTVFETGPPLDLQIASQVAMSLLTTVVEIISAGSAASVDEKVRKLQGDLTDVMGKLSARLEDNDRMRRQLRQAGDEITALRHERDGLRSRLRATEANLTSALKGDAVQAINGEIQKRVADIMRVAPRTKGDA